MINLVAFKTNKRARKKTVGKSSGGSLLQIQFGLKRLQKNKTHTGGRGKYASAVKTTRIRLFQLVNDESTNKPQSHNDHTNIRTIKNVLFTELGTFFSSFQIGFNHSQFTGNLRPFNRSIDRQITGHQTDEE